MVERRILMDEKKQNGQFKKVIDDVNATQEELRKAAQEAPKN